MWKVAAFGLSVVVGLSALVKGLDARTKHTPFKDARTKHMSSIESVASALSGQSVAPASGSQSAVPASGSQSAAPASGSQSAAPASGSQSAAPASGSQSAAAASGGQSVASAPSSQSAAPASGSQSAAPASGSISFNSAGTNGTASYNIGIDMPVYAYYISAPMFADITNQISGNNGEWDAGTPGNSSAAATLDSTGAPTEAPAFTMFTATYPSGTYTLSYTGAPGILSISGCGATLGSPTVKGNSASYPVTFTQQITSTGNNFCMMSLSSTPITNIHLTAPSSLTTGDFLTGWLMKIAPFSTVRYLDPLFTNFGSLPGGGNGTQNWVQRTFPGGPLTEQGYSYDYIIEYANITGKDVWINIPGEATDNYVCRLARLFAFGESGANDNGSNCSMTAPPSGPFSTVVPKGLNSKSHVILEYVNETWNFAFPIANDLYCWANAEPPAGGSCPDGTSITWSPIVAAELANSSLPWSTTANDPFGRGEDLAAAFAKRGGDIFKQVFGSRSNQVIAVMNVQAADPSGGGGNGLNFLFAAFGTGIDRMAVAPYITPADEATQCVSSISTCQSALQASASPGGQTYGWVQSDVSQAANNGIPLISYEGGQGLNGGTQSQDNLEQTVVSDPHMFTIAQQNFTTMWGPLVGQNHDFNWFQLCATELWGALVNCPDHGSQRFDAMLSLILIPGDANYDGKVDINDCNIVLANQGLSSGAFWEDGDFNHDGAVGPDDLAILNQHFSGGNCGKGAGTAAIPTNSLQHFYH
jgi:hypothetical protein